MNKVIEYFKKNSFESQLRVRYENEWFLQKQLRLALVEYTE